MTSLRLVFTRMYRSAARTRPKRVPSSWTRSRISVLECVARMPILSAAVREGQKSTSAAFVSAPPRRSPSLARASSTVVKGSGMRPQALPLSTKERSSPSSTSATGLRDSHWSQGTFLACAWSTCLLSSSSDIMTSSSATRILNRPLQE